MLGVKLVWSVKAMAGLVALVLLGAAVWSTFSLIIACLVKTRERFMGVGQVLTVPLFFASNAVYPTSLMPPWLQGIARANPLTCLVDGLRTLMLGGHLATKGLGPDLTALLVMLTVLMALAARMYPRRAHQAPRGSQIHSCLRRVKDTRR